MEMLWAALFYSLHKLPVQVSLFCKESTEAFTTADAASGTWAVISL